MFWRKGLMAVLTMSLLACVGVRAQHPLPWGPGTLPLAPPTAPSASELSEAGTETPPPSAAPRDKVDDPEQAVSLAPVVLPEQLPLIADPEMPSSLSGGPPVLESTKYSADTPSPEVDEETPGQTLNAELPPAPLMAQAPLPLPIAPPTAPPKVSSAEPSTAPSTESLAPEPLPFPIPPPAASSVIPTDPWGVTGCVDPAARFLAKNQPQLVDLLRDQVLDLEPNGDNRRAIQRVREVVEETQVGVDVSRESWTDDGGPGIQLGGRIHLDWVNWANDSALGGQPNYVEFRRLRLSATGEGYGVMFYELEMEFSPEIDLRGEVVDGVVDLGEFGVEMKDAYLGMRDIPWLGTVLVGHFFTPMGLELQTSSNHITFMERGLPRIFLPGREVGLAAYNRTFGERINWSYGIFFDEVNQAAHAIVDDNQGVRLVGRVSGTPYYDNLSEGRYLTHLGLGYAYTRPRRRNAPMPPPDVDPLSQIELYRPVSFAARPEIHRGSSLIGTGPINTKGYHILNGELAWIRGPLSIQSELTWTSLDPFHGDVINLYGGYVYASYFLTGENRRYDRQLGDFKRMSPYENFWLVGTPRGTSAGWGAWEVAFRWSFLDLSDATGLPLYPDRLTDEVRSQQLNDLTLGVNWYWNPHTRMMFNWIHPFAYDSPLSETTNAEGDIIAMRMQIDY